MLEYIRGTVDSVTPALAVVETGGLGYAVNITLNTYTAIQGKKDVKLYIHEVIREDTHDLYGFSTVQERQIFALLIGVNGVGPNTARIILSGMTVAQLQASILAGNHTSLKAVKGIGPKTAQRIIIELKDKMAVSELEAMALQQSAAVVAPSRDEAQAALVMLGFAKPAVAKALDKIFAASPGLTAEQAIKQALSML